MKLLIQKIEAMCVSIENSNLDNQNDVDVENDDDVNLNNSLDNILNNAEK
jgi:hypothetical protein